MKKRTSAFMIFLMLVTCTVVSAGNSGPPQAGENFPIIILRVPDRTEHGKYLGMKENSTFSFSEIQAKIVIVEIFSMYCPYCQREAPKINQLYQNIERHPDLKGKVKLIGIGAGNTEFEVNVFREKYQIAFPLFSDEDFIIHKLLGEVRTPFFFGVKMLKPPKVFYSKLGGLDMDAFLETLVGEVKEAK